MEKRISIFSGWLVFIIAFVVYILTLEPTISYWDCSEFITCANQLEVGHAPGAPLFMMLGRVFSLFAGNDSSKVAFAVNLLSALASAFTIMFLFRTIEWFGKKLTKNLNGTCSPVYISMAAFIGSMSFAFTDTFWFSAVEGEVYATSSFFSAIVFWLILKWESQPDKPGNDKWILLIFFLMGLSIGIHLLNLLAIPAIVMVYYFKRYKVTRKGVIKALLFSFLLMLFLIFVFIPWFVQLAAYTDLLFVNRFKLPFYSGVFFYLAVITGFIIFLIRYSTKHKKQLLNTVVISLTFIMLGYSSYTALIIRSISNPYIDINNVENIFGLVDYLNREQYAKRPIVYGNNYNSPIKRSIERDTYRPYNGKYVKKELNSKYVFDKKTLTLFPRMASLDESHASEYERWVNIKGKKVKITNRDGGEEYIKVPTFIDNVAFFLKYQLGHMYFRYFMWNFSGRQNNIQGFGEIMHGNWISGIPFIDRIRLGPQDGIPEKYKNNPARNKYYMLPFIFGLVGLIFQYKKDKRNFLITFLLFFLTGVAIVVYLNEIPVTPRERDYVYVGSFYAFSIWIGLSVIALIDKLKMKKRYVNVLVFMIMFFLLPVNLISQNWDDHDRSGRYTARDFSFNYLNSCEKNAILFTSADNDTYPIWYAQEVEKYRRDIRSILIEFLPVDWYIDQLSNKYQGMGAVPISFEDKDFLNGKRLYLPVLNRIKGYVNLKEIIDFIRSDDPRTQLSNYDSSSINYIPARKFKIPVNKKNFMKSCTSFKYDMSKIPDEIYINYTGNYLLRGDLVILDILLNNDWERPVYFLNPNELSKFGLDKYLYREGFAYRLLPFNKDSLGSSVKLSNADYQYAKFMGEFNWGGVNDKNVMLDWTNVRMISTMRMRNQFSYVAKSLAKEGKNKEATEVLDKCIELFPKEKIPYGIYFSDIIEAYYMAGDNEKANELYVDFKNDILDELEYYKSFDERLMPRLSSNIRTDLYFMQMLANIHFPDESKKSDVMNSFRDYYEFFYSVLQ